MPTACPYHGWPLLRSAQSRALGHPRLICGFQASGASPIDSGRTYAEVGCWRGSPLGHTYEARRTPSVP
jgi:hypothetical protein